MSFRDEKNKVIIIAIIIIYVSMYMYIYMVGEVKKLLNKFSKNIHAVTISLTLF